MQEKKTASDTLTYNAAISACEKGISYAIQSNVITGLNTIRNLSVPPFKECLEVYFFCCIHFKCLVGLVYFESRNFNYQYSLKTRYLLCFLCLIVHRSKNNLGRITAIKTKDGITSIMTRKRNQRREGGVFSNCCSTKKSSR